eukprot:GHVQ01013845.1.p1 GENE.GHVQ01013845.1~~GHVQ01013845.1.p1  ORF type:complete len:351 (+),score=69.96 GHVQ01013845.1:64-1053(+)
MSGAAAPPPPASSPPPSAHNGMVATSSTTADVGGDFGDGGVGVVGGVVGGGGVGGGVGGVADYPSSSSLHTDSWWSTDSEDIPLWFPWADNLYKLYIYILNFIFSNKLLQLSCTIGITFLVLVLLSLIFWRYRVYNYNRFLGLRTKSVHNWTMFESSSNPKYCSVCRQLISGFWIYRNTGWECNICARTAHLICLTGCERLPCKTPCLPHPLRHKFVHGNLSSNSVCCVCGIICSSNFGLNGIRCLWCNRTLHEDCVRLLPQLCDLGPFYRLTVPPTAVELSLTNQSTIQQLSAKYGELMGSLQQVQEAMSAGLKEGFKVMSLGMKRIN